MSGRIETLSSAQRETILALHAAGHREAMIAKRLGVTRDTVMRWIDPAWREKRNRMIAEARRRRGKVDASRILPPGIRADIEARLAEIPPDTRDLTGRLLGDPIPGDPRRPWQGRGVR